MIQNSTIKNSEELPHEHYRLCPSCGNFCQLKEPQIHCIICGGEMMQGCSYCNEPIIYPTAKHCHKCGHLYKIDNKSQSKS